MHARVFPRLFCIRHQFAPAHLRIEESSFLLNNLIIELQFTSNKPQAAAIQQPASSNKGQELDLVI
jgi:hypothetical protein